MSEFQCEIYAHLFSGFINSLLGVFLLNVRAFYHKLKIYKI